MERWGAAYGAAFEGGEGPSSPSTAKVETHHEMDTEAWHPIVAPDGVRPPDVVLLVDGVQRVDGMLATEEDDGSSFLALAASFAAGVVRCDLARGAAELVGSQVARALFTASPSVEDLIAGQVRYAAHKVPGSGELNKLQGSVQPPLTALEVEISSTARTDGDLLVVDGPLRGRRHLPRTIGYVKTQQSQYLPPALALIVTSLVPGQRSPIFKQGPAWSGWSWYLRLPGSSGAPWSGIVRVECSPDLSIEQAAELANLSLVTLPRFASTPYKDPRAPQNLIPIAGLERRLRGLLGDARLLQRALAQATARLT